MMELRLEMREKIREGEKSEKVNKVPFPKALVKKNLEKQFSKFVTMFRKLHIDLPFFEVLEKMPLYAKFVKEILSKKRRLSEVDETIMLSEECSAILQRKLPPKLKDPGSFTLPVEFEGKEEVRALCDLGASVNVMPLSMFNRLGIGDLKPTMMCLQLADRSIVRPWGVVEDVLVKVGEFILPADFVVIDVNEDSKIPLILGRPFMATSNAKIKVAKGTISLKVNGKKAMFKIFDIKLKPQEQNDVFLLDMMDEWSDAKIEQFFLKEGFSKKKKEEPKSSPPEQVCYVNVVAIPEPKVEKTKKRRFSWKPKGKKVEVNSESHPKLVEYVSSIEIICKNLMSEIKQFQNVSHHGIDPG